MEIISRKDALALGLNQYFTGNPCVHGHLSNKNSKSGQCMECCFIKNRTKRAKQYFKFRRINNKESLTEKSKKYYEENKEEIRIKQKEYYKNNSEKLKSNTTNYYTKRQEGLAGRVKPENCEVCGKPGDICWDHCHSSGLFRGWICRKCNSILGFANDSPEILENLAKYLRGE